MTKNDNETQECRINMGKWGSGVGNRMRFMPASESRLTTEKEIFLGSGCSTSTNNIPSNTVF